MVKIVVYISQTYLTKLPILHLSPCSPLDDLKLFNGPMNMEITSLTVFIFIQLISIITEIVLHVISEYLRYVVICSCTSLYSV
jgi:hypothetical protein